METNFRDALKGLLNSYSKENGSDTPDWILADYLTGCLHVFDQTLQNREHWYGRSLNVEKGLTVEGISEQVPLIHAVDTFDDGTR